MLGGIGTPMATGPAHQGVVLHSGHDEDDTTGDTGIPTGTMNIPQKQEKEPARQVPVESVQEPMDEKSEQDAGKLLGEESGKTTSDAEISSPAPIPGTDAQVKGQASPADEKATAKNENRSGPGLPVRKPRKPVYPKKKDAKKAKKKSSLPRSARDKVLCKALQKCRNAFIKCKNKIKHPDQSEPWIIAKEVCGGHYKTCVEKDFQPGEWFMTRWFYFQELNCGG